MRMRLRWLVAVLLLVPTPAAAHDHTADVFAAFFSYAQASKLWGSQGTAAMTIRGYEHLSLVGDFAFQKGEHDDLDLTRTTVLGGIRYMFAEGYQKHVPFAQVLIGLARASGDLPSTNDLAFAIGGGYEYLPWGDTSSGGFGIRVSADYVANTGDSFPRASVGIVYRFDH